MSKRTWQEIAGEILGRSDGTITTASRHHAQGVRRMLSDGSARRHRLDGNTLAGWAAGRNLPSLASIERFRARYPHPLWDEFVAALPSMDERKRLSAQRRAQTMAARYGPEWRRKIAAGWRYQQ